MSPVCYLIFTCIYSKRVLRIITNLCSIIHNTTHITNSVVVYFCYFLHPSANVFLDYNIRSKIYFQRLLFHCQHISMKWQSLSTTTTTWCCELSNYSSIIYYVFYWYQTRVELMERTIAAFYNIIVFSRVWAIQLIYKFFDIFIQRSNYSIREICFFFYTAHQEKYSVYK